MKHNGQFGKKKEEEDEEERRRRRRRSVWIGQEKHLLVAAWSGLCSSIEERLVLEDDLRGSRDFLATDFHLSKGKVRFSIKCVQFGNCTQSPMDI